MAVFDKNAKGVREMLTRTYNTFDFDGTWYDAFGTPETTGTWLIWGNSANGKSTFAMQLCKYLCRYGKVAYNSLEEGAGLTMKNTMERCGMNDVNTRFLLIDGESIEQLNVRLKRPKAPKIVVIDSFQYTQLSYKQYIDFKSQHPNKLLIFISHADGKLPSGRSARSVMYDVSLKIYIEGFRAFSKGRFTGPLGYIDIWADKAQQYYSTKNKDNHEEDQQQDGDTTANQGDTCQLPQCG